MKIDSLELPEGYFLKETIDLQKNRKLALAVNMCALFIAAAMVFIATRFIPIKSAYTGPVPGMVKLCVIIVGMVAYIFLHELTHGLFFYIFSGHKPFYGFSGLYAYAGSDAFYCRSHYLIIGLAPVIIWGLVLCVINIFIPYDWFWVVFIIQVINISGAAGDVYVFSRLLNMRGDVLVKDAGAFIEIFYYLPEKMGA